MGTKIKTFESTGLAPNGRLYAGDLNGIQDHLADQSNFSQQVDAGVYSIGEAPLQLMRYGPGEARISGAARLDGILRALGGLYAGAFTTTQRNSIPSGYAPYGLVILNSTTNQYEWNKGTDVARNWQSIGSAITHVVDVVANRPNANTVVAGSTYYATDQSVLYVSDNNAWLPVGVPDNAVTSAKIALDTITAADIAPNAIGSSELADAAVDTAAIQDGAVTTAKIAGSAVGSGQIAGNSISAGHIQGGAVGSAQIADNSIQPYDLNSIVLQGKRLESGRYGPFNIPANQTVNGQVNYAAAFGGTPILILSYDPNGDAVWNPNNRCITGTANWGFTFSFSQGSSGVGGVYLNWIAMGA
jgi:hypothetical protein